jgi:sodium-coupled monocarboxylate transporter 8/12
MRLSLTAFNTLLAVPIVVWWFLPAFSRLRFYSVYEFLEGRFNLTLRLATSVLFLLIRGAHVSIIIYAPALMMSELAGLPAPASILAVGFLTAVYTALGGMKAVIWTDAIQTLTVFTGFAAVFAATISQLPHGLTAALTAAGRDGRLAWFDFSRHIGNADNSWAILLGGTLLSIRTLTTDQAVMQKYFATRSPRDTAKSIVFYALISAPITILLSLLGILLSFVYTARPELSATLKNPDAVLPHFAAHMLRPGLAGLVFAALLAGAMATTSSSLNALSTASVLDVYKRLFRSGKSDRHYAAASRWATLFWGAVATCGALFAGRLGDLILSFVKISSFFGGSILGIFLLGVFTKTVGSGLAISAALAGLAAVIAAALWTTISPYWYVAIGCGATLAWSWAGLNVAAPPKRTATGEPNAT